MATKKTSRCAALSWAPAPNTHTNQGQRMQVLCLPSAASLGSPSPPLFVWGQKGRELSERTSDLMRGRRKRKGAGEVGASQPGMAGSPPLCWLLPQNRVGHRPGPQQWRPGEHTQPPSISGSFQIQSLAQVVSDNRHQPRSRAGWERRGLLPTLLTQPPSPF